MKFIKDVQAERQRLAKAGYVETFPNTWERAAATQELLCQETMRKDFEWIVLRDLDREDAAEGRL